MGLNKLLIANRGEIAIRIIRAAGELGIASAAVFSDDDAESPHVRLADEAYSLEGSGVRSYLDIDRLIRVAKRTGCDAIHPGYGFLAESAALARGCTEAGLTFVGPSIGTLELLGDKSRARVLAEEQGVPVLPGSAGSAHVWGIDPLRRRPTMPTAVSVMTGGVSLLSLVKKNGNISAG